MYDYVILLMFDDKTILHVSDLKEILDHQNVKTPSKLPPHITIDLYENISGDDIVKKVDKFIDQIKSFSFNFVGLDHFDNRVQFLKPDHLEAFNQIKNIFDQNLGEFKIKNNANKDKYKPHLTLSTNNNTSEVKRMLKEEKTIFESQIKSIAIFSNTKQLIKKYDLN